ncbi:hypothetical protein L915_13608 [Phytophthora nicotianae]|uniref:Uncharacterized protein n=1 Tax=Phytophthora nicotianae TaxID=4792 RepID=W2GEZ2_PHYNI|nr:hypothetical protein L915_13608 [Phytophthora nicotianae]ETL34247.1 hypothetical protein L916_13505 [Phytophthora nicotianae]
MIPDTKEDSGGNPFVLFRKAITPSHSIDSPVVELLHDKRFSHLNRGEWAMNGGEGS